MLKSKFGIGLAIVALLGVVLLAYAFLNPKAEVPPPEAPGAISIPAKPVEGQSAK